MGASSSTLNKLVTEEFDRLSKGRPHLVLDDILEFRLNSGGWVVSTDCVGLLYSIDKDRDGRFQLSEVKQFVSVWNHLGKNISQHELQSNIHSLCMAQFWKEIHSDAGLTGATEWLVQVAASNYVPPTLLEPAEADTLPLVTPESAVASILSAADQYDGPDCAPRQFDGYPGVAYINQQNMLGLYRILAHQGKHQHDLAHFNNILQKVAEDQNLLPLDDPAMDDWVPAPVVSNYVSEVLQNCKQLVSEMGMVETILHHDLNSRSHIPPGGLEDSPELEDWANDDSTELRPPAELNAYSEMSPAALQPPLSSSSSPEMQRQMSGSRVPPLRLGRASGPVPSLSAESSARRSPAAMRSPGTRLNLQHAVSSGRVPLLQLAQPAVPSTMVPALKLDVAGRKPETQSAASRSHRQLEPHASTHSSTARSSAEPAPSSTEQAGSSGGRVPPLRLGRTGTGGGMVPSLQLASASGGEPTLQRASTHEHDQEMHGRRDSEVVSALRLSSPSGSEPDLSHVEKMTELPVPPLRTGKNSAAVPLLQLGNSQKVPERAVQAVPAAALKPVESHPLTHRSEESASSRGVPGQVVESSTAVVLKAAEGMQGAQQRQPRAAMQGGAADAQVAGSSRVVPDEPTPRYMPTSRPSSRPVSARHPPDKLSARRPSDAGSALREGLSARHMYDGEASHSSSNHVGASMPSGEHSSRPGSSRLSHTGPSSQGDAAEALGKMCSGMAAASGSGKVPRPRSGKHAEWQSTTKDYSQPGTAPWRPVSQQAPSTEHTASRANSAQLSSQGREAVMQGLVDGPRPGRARTDLSTPQRRLSPALASPVKSSLSSPSTSARQHPARDRHTSAHLAKAVADGRVQVERPDPEGIISHGGRITLRGRPPDESSSSSGPISGGRSAAGRGERTKGRTSSLVQTWRGKRPSAETKGSGDSRRPEWQAPGRGSPDGERSVARRSLDRQQSLLVSPHSPGQNSRGAKVVKAAVKESPERSSLADRPAK